MRHDYTNKQWKDLDGAKPQRRLKLRYVLIVAAIIIVIGIISWATDHDDKSSGHPLTQQTKPTVDQPHYHTIQLTIPPKESP
jgi:hypothetical protein